MRLGLLAVITASVLWGASFFFGKVALEEVPADQVVLWRFVLALIVLVPLVLWRARPRRGHKMQTPLRRRPRRRDWPLFILNAVLMVPVQFMLQFEGLARTTASSAALIVGAFAPMLAVAAALLANERMGRLGWGAVICSTIGLIIMVGGPGEGRTLLGDLMVFTSLIAAVGMVLTTQRLVREYDSLVVTVAGMGMGTLLLLPWTLIVSGLPTLDLTGATWAALLGLGIGCTAITFSLWNYGLRFVPASHAGVFINLEPLIGAVLGIALLGDELTLELVAGGCLILASAVIVSWPSSPAVGVGGPQSHVGVGTDLPEAAPLRHGAPAHPPAEGL